MGQLPPLSWHISTFYSRDRSSNFSSTLSAESGDGAPRTLLFEYPDMVFEDFFVYLLFWLYLHDIIAFLPQSSQGATEVCI